MLKLSSALVIVSLLSGCSANWHLKKAIAKDPSILTEGVVIERVTDTITVVTPELQVDTIHEWSVDTVTTYVDRVRIRTKVDTVQRTVFVDVVCPADTIYVPHTYEKTTIRPVVKPKRSVPLWAYLLLAVILGTLLSKVL
jgi:hypothetical protein